MAFLDRFRRRAASQAVPAVVAKREPHISMSALAALSPASTSAADMLKETFRIPEPPPGVLPAGIKTMAQDEDISGLFGFAQGDFGFAEGLGFLGYTYLSELAQRPEYRRISEIIAKQMTRKWIKLEATGDEDKSEKIKALGAALEKFKVRDHFRHAAELDGFFGRAHIYFDTGDGDRPDELKTPLLINAAKIGRNSLKRLKVIEPLWTYPGTYSSSDPLKPDYFRPSSWYVQGKEVHISRIPAFVGREMPDMLKPAYMFGGLSLSQMAKPYVDNWIRTRQSVSDLIHSFSVNGIKTNLADVLAGGGAEDLVRRAELFNRTRDNRGLMMLNNDTEEFFNVSTPLGTLDKLQAQAQEHMASVAGIPLVILLGITPSGLNASSDGEIKVFYDWIHSQQEHLFGSHLKKTIEIIQLSEFGEIDREIGFRFEPLWQLNEKELAEKQNTEAQTDALNIESGVITALEARTRVANAPDSPYHGLDVDDVSLPDPGELDPPKPVERRREEASAA